MLISLKKNLILLLGIVFLLGNVFLIYRDFYFFLLLPLALLIIYFAIFSIEKLFYIIVFFTPLSFNLETLGSGNIGIYLPTEPLLLGLIFIYLFKTFFQPNFSLNTFWKHPISFLVLLQLVWILITSVLSEFPIVSFKFFLARLWFVIPIYFLGIHIFKKRHQLH